MYDGKEQTPSTDKGIKTHIHRQRTTTSLEKKEILPFSTIQMDLEDIMPSDIHQILWQHIPHMWKSKTKPKLSLKKT